MGHGIANTGRAWENEGLLSRERAVTLALIVASAVVFYLCYRIVLPFLPALAWALALAVISHPLHRWIVRRIHFANLAAASSVVVVALVVVIPVVFVTHTLFQEGDKYVQAVQHELTSGKWRSSLDQHPRLNGVLPWIDRQLGIQPSDPTETGTPVNQSNENDGRSIDDTSRPDSGAPSAADSVITNGVSTVVTGTVWLLAQWFITFLSLFFFFRDQDAALGVLRSLLPLSNSEIDDVFKRADDTIHVTVRGSLIVAMVQGSMGGLMFWWLGLPGPVLWGAVMGLLAVVPVLGTFVVWAPTALWLALHNDWKSALILASWGSIAIGLVDNVLYPYLVGKRLRFHTLLVFFAIAGGLMLFGASGVILGPLLLAVADAFLRVWKHRTAFGGTIEDGVECST